MTAETVIAFRHVALQFGDERVLDGITFDVPQATFICLLGPSGCGKSTTLRIIGGLLGITSGHVSVYGHDPAESWHRLAYVFQSPRLVNWRTALDNVILGMQLRFDHLPRSAMRERAQRHLEMVGLTHDAEKFPGMLSGGERQRVSLARALAVEPDVILMDEPFASLDITTRQRLRDEVIRIWRDTGKTIIFVTHDLDEALYLADQVVVFSNKPTTILKTLTLTYPRPRDIHRDPVIGQARDDLRNLFASMAGMRELVEPEGAPAAGA